MNIEEYLIEKGYPISSKGGFYFSMLLEEVVYSISQSKTNEEIREELPNIEADYYNSFFRMDKEVYFREINKFCKSVKNKDKKLNDETIEDKLIRMGRDIVKINDMSCDMCKSLIKRK